MSINTETFVRCAKAEKELCDEAGPVLTRIISEIQDRHGISIAELRVTMDWSHSANGWPAANCVMVREQDTHEMGARSEDVLAHAVQDPSYLAT